MPTCASIPSGLSEGSLGDLRYQCRQVLGILSVRATPGRRRQALARDVQNYDGTIRRKAANLVEDNAAISGHAADEQSSPWQSRTSSHDVSRLIRLARVGKFETGCARKHREPTLAARRKGRDIAHFDEMFGKKFCAFGRRGNGRCEYVRRWTLHLHAGHGPSLIEGKHWTTRQCARQHSKPHGYRTPTTVHRSHSIYPHR